MLVTACSFIICQEIFCILSHLIREYLAKNCNILVMIWFAPQGMLHVAVGHSGPPAPGPPRPLLNSTTSGRGRPRVTGSEEPAAKTRRLHTHTAHTPDSSAGLVRHRLWPVEITLVRARARTFSSSGVSPAVCPPTGDRRRIINELVLPRLNASHVVRPSSSVHRLPSLFVNLCAIFRPSGRSQPCSPARARCDQLRLPVSVLNYTGGAAMPFP